MMPTLRIPSSSASVSIGLSQPDMPSGPYTFRPSTAGSINRHPSTILPGPSLYCWELGDTQALRRGVLIVQLPDASTLRMEARPGVQQSCATQGTLSFGTAVFTYAR